MRYITNREQVRSAVEAIEPVDLVALDTEAAGYHRYADRICLVQLSTRDQTYIVDALAVDIAELNSLVASTTREIVIHDAEYDLRLLSRDHGIRIGRLFDTKLAAQMLGEPAIGLAGLVEKYLHIRLDKKHQRADWAQRPLPRELLEYAADDTRHLLALRDRLRDALEAKHRLHWAEEESMLRISVEAAPSEDGAAFLRMKNIRDLTPRQLAALREIHAWRDRVASDRDVAPFRVLSNEVMIAVARRMPGTTAELGATPGVDAAGQRHARELVQAVERARHLSEHELPAKRRGPRRPAPDPAFDSLVERLKQVRDRVADQLQLDRGFLMPRQQLEDIATARPASPEELQTIPGMRNWQVEAMGYALQSALR